MNILEYLKKMRGEDEKVDSAIGPKKPQAHPTVPSWMRPRPVDPMNLPSQPSQEDIAQGAWDPSAQFMMEALAKEEKRKKAMGSIKGDPTNNDMRMAGM